MKLKELIKGIKIIKTNNGLNREISGIFYDSRKIIPDGIFVAVKGTDTDGHNFIQEAIEKGAKTIIVQRKGLVFPSGITQILVEDSRKVLGEISTVFYQEPSLKMKVFGVTGTKGKTTITYILRKIFQEAGYKTGLIGTINYQIGERILPSTNTTPESVDIQRMFSGMLENHITHAIIEVSSHALAQGRISGIHFDCGIFTNIAGHEHLDYHKTFRDYVNTKLSFFSKYLKESKKEKKSAVINLDNKYGKLFMREALSSNLDVCTYALNKKADVHPEDIEYHINGTGFSLDGRPYFTPLIGDINLSNCLSAICVAKIEGIPDVQIKTAIENMPVVPGRMEFIEQGQPFKVIIDFAHTHQALTEMLNVISGFRKKGRLILVFGCGGNRDKSKRPLMGSIAVKMADIVILTSDNPRNEDEIGIIKDIEKGIPFWRRKKHMVFVDRKEAVRQAINIAREDDWVIIAGKGHETVQIIGNVYQPFNDREIAVKSIKEKIS
ncbi:MAG: UDP-N-acetylmuramoyl-L-alanyl-D-glutamate--2,6-diaminopimelate ligase [Candidatus Omnitrophica bacterium]|nr:UDP-N-acetylmuramoyl-L-alanyl-D-glutamate--2,6-diaminopimelate ligase [Candidatus Omnitrophota bacterium]